MLDRDFGGYSKQSEELWQCPCICSSANKVQPKLHVLYYESFLETFKAQKFGVRFIWG